MAEKGVLLDIRIRIRDEAVKERFLKIKNAIGLTNNTEVLRFIIKKFPLNFEIIGTPSQEKESSEDG